VGDATVEIARLVGVEGRRCGVAAAVVTDALRGLCGMLQRHEAARGFVGLCKLAEKREMQRAYARENPRRCSAGGGPAGGGVTGCSPGKVGPTGGGGRR
jgi:hypothetical protein